MSTRANIVLKEGKDKLYFYRHSDGYPRGAMPLLERFTQWGKDGKIRKDLQQCAGWLIVLGAIEYCTIPTYEIEVTNRYGRERKETKDETIQPPNDWKVGSIEPTTCLHGDIEYLYTIDIETMEIKAQKTSCDYQTWQ